MCRFLGIDSRLLTIGSLVGIVLIVSLIISMAITPSELAFPFVHAAVEAVGSFFAIVVAWHSFITYMANPRESHRVWIGLAFLNMGILYGFHALTAPGTCRSGFGAVRRLSAARCRCLCGYLLGRIQTFRSEGH